MLLLSFRQVIWPQHRQADSSERRNIEAMWRLRWELGGRLDVV